MIEKKLHRFFVSEISPMDQYVLTDPRIAHHIVTVLRFKVGERIVLFSEGTDDVVYTLIALSKGASKHSVTLQKETVIVNASTTMRTVIAAISIVKRDVFELIVQKLTELGVSAIVPVISSRTIKHSVRRDRLELISLEAVEQCGGNSIVKIHEPLTLKKSLEQFPFPSLYFHPEGKKTETIQKSEKMVLYIGPEGGWSMDDIHLFQDHTIEPFTLGSHILRTETAAIVGSYELLKEV